MLWGAVTWGIVGQCIAGVGIRNRDPVSRTAARSPKGGFYHGGDMRRFINPANGYEERVSGFAVLWAFLFGAFYFAWRGVWTHAVVYFGLVLVLISILGPFAILVLLPLWIVYALLAPGIVARDYLRRGWREVRS